MNKISQLKTIHPIPAFVANGDLPPGIHETTWDEFKVRYGVNHRRKLQLKGLEKAIQEFTKSGCTIIYIDGSFVTNKKNPGDFDALYDLEEVNDLIIDQVLLDASRTGREKMKKYYEGEFFPAYIKAQPNGTIYLDFFQKNKKTKEPKGIIKIKLE
ncbi:hypothetical protein [Sporosarcina sp. JAI121]|uniref:DUF6932 family protein n=1 Tax=Sporosarcina sp. JAI121 TaxID=2723064 RepID=UPI0015CB7D9D|nr:hypothetical protein [Sporosarcina sp. JAI121]NYF26050.1 hypothetical protein [Sporosarcina sp. JAI121]